MNAVLYLIAAIAGFFLVLRGYIWLSGFLKEGKPVPRLDGELGRKIQSGERVLLYFYSPACIACRTMTPVIDTMQDGKKNIFKINVQNESAVTRRLGVMGTPAVVIVENMQISQFILGARPEKYLRKLI